MENITILRTLGTKDFNYVEPINLYNQKDNTKQDNIESKFYDGRLMVSDASKYGFINENGQKVVDLKYDYAEDFKNGFAKVGNDSKRGIRFGLIGLFGEEIIKPKYSNLTHFIEGIAIAKTEKDKCIAFDTDGTKITKKLYDYISTFHEGVAIVEQNKKYGFIDKEGNEIVPLIYDRVDQFKDGFAIVTLNNDNQYEKGIIDKKGNVVIPIKLKSVTNINENRFIGEGYNNYIYIYNEKGFVVNVLDYDSVSEYNNGYSGVSKRDKLGLIDINGKEIIAPKYSVLYSASNVYKESKGLYIFEEKEKYGVIDNNGKIIVKPIYDRIAGVNKDYIIVCKEKKFGLTTRDGILVTDIIYSSIRFMENYIILKTRDISTIFDRPGEEFSLKYEDASFDIVIKYQDKKIVRKFDTLAEREQYYELLKEEVEEENIKYKNRREEIERKLIEEEISDFETFKEKVKNIKSKVM